MPVNLRAFTSFTVKKQTRHNFIPGSCRSCAQKEAVYFYLQKRIPRQQLKICVDLPQNKFSNRNISLLRTARLLTQNLLPVTQKFDGKWFFIQSTETTFQPPKRKKYALAGFTKSTRYLFQKWREAKLLIVLVSNFMRFPSKWFF